MFINKYIENLRLGLTKALPSAEAHQKMMPSSRRSDLISRPINANTRQSSVLILFYPKQNELYTIFIKRQEYDGVHSGQIAFPGGKYEPDDKNLIYTALREANEEVGIDISSIEILGELSELFIPPSNYLVLPVVAYTERIPEFIPDIKEVNQIIEVSLNELLSTANISSFEFNGTGNKKIIAPCYIFNDHKVWGATAMIVSELTDVLRNI
ncbi:MAG: CoA pyrophosphatase [Bacteroidetes bacterium]|nr:CoA pyrophosphatase [Bacteroidota bacterium]